MVDIEKVIKGLYACTSIDENGVTDGECKICPYDKDFAKGACWVRLCCDAIELLKEQLKEQPHWIPVKERLPKSMANKVIVYLQHEDLVSHIGYGHYERHKDGPVWYDLETHEPFINYGYTVTHWMPMPKSPEGEELCLD